MTALALAASSLAKSLHIVGYAREGTRFTDDHAHPIQDELLELAPEVLA